MAMNDGTERLELTHRVGVDGVIYLSAKGRIDNDEIERFSRWADEVKALIAERAALGDDPILVLTDITEVSHFERQPIAVVKELLLHDKQYRIRSAFVGGTRFVTLVLDSIVSLLRRDNIRRFSAKEPALRWLAAARKERAS